MYQLTQLNTHIQSVLLRSSLKGFEKIAFYNMAVLLFKDVSIEGTLCSEPAIVVDTLQGDPALIMAIRFHNATHDVVSYTFQFECWPTAVIQRIPQPLWLREKITAIPKPRMKLSFLAERNSVAYFDQAFEGSFKETLRKMAKVLGR